MPPRGRKKQEQKPVDKTEQFIQKALARRAPVGPPAGSEDIQAQIKQAKRDATGLVQGGAPHLTEDQFLWLSYRLGVAADKEATELSGIPGSAVTLWMTQPEFHAVYTVCLQDKRDAFRALGTQLLPKALRVINEMLDSASPRSQSQGLNYLLRTQALLIDKIQQVDPNAINALMNSLRESKPVQVLEGQFTEVKPAA